MASLFDRDPGTVTWDELGGFLKEGHLDHVDLKFAVMAVASVAVTFVMVHQLRVHIRLMRPVM